MLFNNRRRPIVKDYPIHPIEERTEPLIINQNNNIKNDNIKNDNESDKESESDNDIHSIWESEQTDWCYYLKCMCCF